MHQEDTANPLKTLQDIHSIMERSARFLSLSGWSGVWAGCTALAGAAIARQWLHQAPEGYFHEYSKSIPIDETNGDYRAYLLRFAMLAIVVLVVALAGGYFFTMRKARKEGATLWSPASRRMVFELAVPLAIGGIFAFVFLYRGLEAYIPAICLVFYGLALINGSKHTLSDIRYLGFFEIALGIICLFLQGYGLLLWTVGFGVLHILYGIIMWSKYDRQAIKDKA
ncbi:MAG TPA: hypothetical protein VGD89_02435 [Flavipsychrobacter sp.]